MNDIERLVLQKIGENLTSPDVFADTDEGLRPIRDSINDAIQEICGLTGYNERIYYLPLDSGKAFYKLSYKSGHFGWVTNAWLVNQKRRLIQTDVTKLSLLNPRWMLDSGSPDEYFQVGNDTIGFYKKPSGSDDVVKLTCVIIPPRYNTSTDRIFLKNSFQWAVVHYAVSEYWASVGDAREAKYHFDKYLGALNLQNLYPRRSDNISYLRTEKTHEVRNPT